MKFVPARHGVGWLHQKRAEEGMERLKILWEVHLKECEREWESESGATRTRLGRQTWTVVLYVCSSSYILYYSPLEVRRNKDSRQTNP